MSHQQYLLLHKSEWERLKRPNNITQNTNTSREEYFKSLEDKSKSWIQNWPDTTQGAVFNVEKRKTELKEKERKVLATFLSKKKETEKLLLADKAEAIERAKDIIFEDSGYGRQLISALRESQAIEERDVQIEFNAKLKAQNDLLEKDNKSQGLINVLTNKSRENSKVEENKQKIKQIELFNKEMFNLKKEQDKKRRKKEIKLETEHNDIIKKIQEREDKYAAKECFVKKDMDDFMAQQKRIKELKAAREKYEDKIIELWRKYADKVRSKEKIVFDKIHKERYNTSDSIKIYDLLENIQNEEKRKYENFVEKGIQKSLELAKKREVEDRKQQSMERQKRRLIDDENKKRATNGRRNPINNIICTESVDSKMKELKTNNVPKNTLNSNSSPFTTEQNKLLKELKRREKEPSPWSGSAAAHAEFFRHANDTLKQCRYKTNIRKIIDDYIKENNLGSDYVHIVSS